jgi:FAD:protein FMN transferase
VSGAALTSAFPAMSTTVTVVAVGIDRATHEAAMRDIRAVTAAWEQRFSRFRPDSMLSRVNVGGANWTAADDTFLDLIVTAREAVFATGGRFNPAILNALRDHGYDRTIYDVRAGVVSGVVATRPIAGMEAWREVEIDRRGGRIRLPVGLRVDFGGIAKGALADRLADRYGRWPGGAISIGGDIRLWGAPPDGDSWRVGIEHPLHPERDFTTIEVYGHRPFAVATSSRTKRLWRTAEGEAHHLIDPGTGRPASTPLLAVTACAATATAAEIVTKNVLIGSAHGPVTGRDLLDAEWALTVSETLEITRITKETA